MRALHSLSNPRSFLALVHDVLVAAVAWALAYYLRFNFAIPAEFVFSMWQNLLWVLPIQVASFFFFGLYEGMWRFASIPDLKRILKSIVIAAMLIVTVMMMHKPLGVIPRSVLILDPLLLMLLMGGSRLAYRAWKEHTLYGGAQKLGKPVLILGAGEAAITLVKDLARSEDWQVVGLLDDNTAVHGRQLLEDRKSVV